MHFEPFCHLQAWHTHIGYFPSPSIKSWSLVDLQHKKMKHKSEHLRSCFFPPLKYFCIKGLGCSIFAYLAVRNLFRKREMLCEMMCYGGKGSAVLPRATAIQLSERLWSKSRVINAQVCRDCQKARCCYGKHYVSFLVWHLGPAMSSHAYVCL